jgi:hypothetical protein
MNIRMLGAALVLTACSIETADDNLAAQSEDDIKASSESYFIVTHQDFRKCMSPMCGGWFVAAVNKKTTRCSNGKWSAECHAYTIDASALGLSQDEAAQLSQTFGEKHAIVRGKLVSVPQKGGLAADTLIISAAWKAAALSTPKGQFFSVRDNGIVCITFPCLSVDEKTLNVGSHHKLAGVDLAASGASQELVSEGYAAMSKDGILAAGTHTTETGPAGKALALEASEFYLAVKATKLCQPKACGPQLGMPNKLCSDGVHFSGPTGRCIDKGTGCGWEIASCPAN